MTTGLPVYTDANAATAGYPTTPLTVPALIDKIVGRSSAVYTGTVPALAPYQVQFPVTQDQSRPVVTVATNARTLVVMRFRNADGSAPTAASGQVGWDPQTGVLTFNSADAGGTISWTGIPLKHVLLANYLVRLMAEIRATQVETDTKQDADALLTAIAGLTTVADRLIYTTGVDTVALATLTSFARGLLDDADAATARTTLGLGTMAVETASDYLTKAGNLSGLADAATARGNLGLGGMATQSAGAVAITGGTVNGTSIGATTPSTGAFSQLSAPYIQATSSAGVDIKVSGGTTVATFGAGGGSNATLPATNAASMHVSTARWVPVVFGASGPGMTATITDSNSDTITIFANNAWDDTSDSGSLTPRWAGDYLQISGGSSLATRYEPLPGEFRVGTVITRVQAYGNDLDLSNQAEVQIKLQRRAHTASTWSDIWTAYIGLESSLNTVDVTDHTIAAQYVYRLEITGLAYGSTNYNLTWLALEADDITL